MILFIETWLLLYSSMNFKFYSLIRMLGNCNNVIILQTHMLDLKAESFGHMAWTAGYPFRLTISKY
jgi:hypothetical protein